MGYGLGFAGLFNSSYFLLVFIPAIILSLGAQFLVSSAFNKWTKVRNTAGLTGAQAARKIIETAGLQGVQLEGTPGVRTDHFDPTSNVVRMSQDVATTASVAAMAVAAHELGHAQQYAEKSIFIQMRRAIAYQILRGDNGKKKGLPCCQRPTYSATSQT